MKKLVGLFVMGLALAVWIVPAQAKWNDFGSEKTEEKKTEANESATAASAVAAPAAATPAAEEAPVDEAKDSFIAVSNQKENVEREKALLEKMQNDLSAKYHLDVEKLKNGHYDYDSAKKEFVEKAQ